MKRIYINIKKNDYSFTEFGEIDDKENRISWKFWNIKNKKSEYHKIFIEVVRKYNFLSSDDKKMF
ncbi:hypothetical protein [[Mycoplasma] phocae]|nr:hypothetical protein [[Mycoplasma] phocae]